MRNLHLVNTLVMTVGEDFTRIVLLLFSFLLIKSLDFTNVTLSSSGVSTLLPLAAKCQPNREPSQGI